MIIEAFKNKFDILKRQGINIQYVLDIGSYRGHFTNTIKSVWPTAIIKQFEADERQKEYLQKDAFITLLGDEFKTLDFYTISEDKVTTGSSIYKENTPFYSDKTTIVLQKDMVTLDSLDQKHNFYGNWKEQGLIKIDTQGSELIILKGSNSFLEKRQPRFILIECPIMEYNLGAPKFDEYIYYMKQINYDIKDVFDMSYDGLGNLLQIDLLFEREKL
jgi:FkbM family methyltransferase